MPANFDNYFAKTKTWGPEKRCLREILKSFPLSEELKWRSPCYTFEGSNVVILSSRKDFCELGFFKGALIDDPDGLLLKPGENSQSARHMTFRSVEEIREKEAPLREIIARAIENEKAGLKVDFKARDHLKYPTELTEMMTKYPDFRSAFEALTPGRRRGYNLFFTAAKQSKTRIARIEKHMPRILEGKGMHDR